MRHFSSSVLKQSAICIACALAAQVAQASGYHFGTQSVSAQATANASAAEAADASTIFYNPAGLSHLPGIQVSGNLDLVAPNVKYSDARAAYPGAPGVPVQGKVSGKITKDLVAVPHMYGSYQINDQWTAGLGIYVPFASETQYDPSSVTRYNISHTKLTALDINPTLAFKLNDRHSLGFGFIAQHASAELTQYANFGTLAAQAAGVNPALRAYMIGKGMLPNFNGVADGVANVKGSDWGYGFTLGWLWDASDNMRVGASYRSKVKHTLTGDASWRYAGNAGVGTVDPVLTTVMPGVMTAAGYMASEKASVDIVTPASLSLHGMWKIDPQWNLFGDLTWTQHSAFNKLDIVFQNPKAVANATAGGVTRSNAAKLRPNWRDTFKLALGASYQYSQPLQLRFGIAYDQSPVRSANERLTTMPDNDRIWLSGGIKYALSKNSTLNLAYSYLHIKKASSNFNGWCGSQIPAGPGAASCVSSRTSGSSNYTSRAQILGLAYNYQF